MQTLLKDFRYGLRMLAKNPVFTTVAVLTLALGIGANTSIFSVVSAVLLNPLPYSDANRLVMVKEVLPKVGPQPVTVSAPDIEQIRKLNRVFENIAGYRGWGIDMPTKDETERVFANRVSSSLFRLVGVQPLIGRNFTEQEDHLRQNVVILSYRLWQRCFAGSREVTGQTVTLDCKPYTIVGVMPKNFVFPWGPPQSTDPWLTVVGVVGDVKQGPLDVATVPHTYEPYVQLGGAIQNFVVALRAEGDSVMMANGLRELWSLRTTDD